jgi:hypothetical protein
MPTVARTLSALILAAFATSAGAAPVWNNITQTKDWPLKKVTQEEYDISATGRIEVRGLGGDVDVRAGEGNQVSFTYVKRAPTQRDMDCETLRYEHDADSLRIWVAQKRSRECRSIESADKLTLTVPRGATLDISGIGETVSVAGVEGFVRLSSIGDSAKVTGGHQVEARSIGDSVEVDITELGPRGVRLDSIGDSVSLTLPEKLDAKLRISSVGDSVRAPGLRLSSDDDDYETVIGQGGPLIRINSIGDTVTIRGPHLDRASGL